MTDEHINNEATDFDFEQYPNACKIIAEYDLDVDLKYLPIMEYAEHNLGPACIELFLNFRDGKNGFPESYEGAKYYAEKLKDIAYDSPEPLLRFDAHKNIGYMEAHFGHYDLAINELNQALEVMRDLPPEKWDDELLNNISEIENYV